MADAWAEPRSDWTYELRGPVVLVVDQDAGRSITNDAEHVIAGLLQDGLDLDRRRVIYRDTCGLWDELRHDGQRFTGFAILNARTPESAILRLGHPPRRLGQPAPEPG